MLTSRMLHGATQGWRSTFLYRRFSQKPHMPQHWGPSGWSEVQGWQLRFLRSMFRWMDMSIMCGKTWLLWPFGFIPRCKPAG